MKIVHIAKHYLPHLGGVEIHLKELNSLLVKMGHEVVVIVQKHNSKLSDSASYGGVEVIRIPQDNKKNSVKTKQQTWKFIKKHRQLFLDADVVHVHDVFWWILPIYKLIRKKTFITFHGWETEYPVRFNAKFQRYLYSKLSQGSIHIGKWIQQFYFDKPDFITYGAINAKRLTKSRMGKKKNTSSRINLTFIGRLSQDNSVEKYIEVVEVLKARGHKVDIVWVGDGEYRKECEKLGKVTGFVKNISKHLVDKDLIFASSYLSILEAQLLENNVCAFYSNKLKKAYLETFPGNKYLLSADTTESMMRKITFLLNSPKLKNKLGHDAKEFAQKQSWSKVLDLYLKLWSSDSLQ